MTKIILIIWFLLSISFNSLAADFSTPLTFVGQNYQINVALASNQAERERGLMYQAELQDKQGMLFIYPDQSQRDMWMKNMLIALDVVFLDKSGHIVSALINLPPCQKNPCKIYPSQAEFTYMLELKAGFIQQHQLELGQSIQLPDNVNSALTN